MSEMFEWKDEYCIGISKIDSQHKNLFAIANRLQHDLDHDQLQGELMNLFRYTREHFKTEEELMRDCGYPDYANHQRMHDGLLNSLNNFAAEVVKKPEQLPAFKQFVADWITEHILNQDQRIASHFFSAS
jgi:hemerythrin